MGVASLSPTPSGPTVRVLLGLSTHATVLPSPEIMVLPMLIWSVSAWRPVSVCQYAETDTPITVQLASSN